jgi:hypothetical protein
VIDQNQKACLLTHAAFSQDIPGLLCAYDITWHHFLDEFGDGCCGNWVVVGMEESKRVRVLENLLR